MNHDLDFDRDHDTEDTLDQTSIKETLQQAADSEEEMMRRYLITAERIHDHTDLAHRLREFAEGNAKRSRQLNDELGKF